MEYEAYYRQQLTDAFRDFVEDWRSFLADRDDKRLPHEKWRSLSSIPWAYSQVETGVAVLSDIVNSSDPAITAEGVGKEDIDRARKMERINTYILDKNRWLSNQDMSFRTMKIQGTHVWKLIHVNRTQQVRVHPTIEDLKAFEAAVQAAVDKGAGDAPADPQQFEAWRETVNTSQLYDAIPETPTPGVKDLIEYRGPWLERTSLFDLRFDPRQDDWSQQDLIFQRIVKPREWVEARTGDEPGKPFDPRQVKAAISATGERQFSEWEDQISAMLGFSRTGENPIYREAVELFEVWQRGNALPFMVILNRRGVINKFPDTHPYWHGQSPYTAIRNVPLAGHALGLSDLRISRSLFKEINIFHDLYLDALTLAVLPVFLKTKDMGLPEIQRFLRPGGMLDVARADGIQQMTKVVPPTDVVHTIDRLKFDSDEAAATGGNVRGQTASIGRVSATEATGRLNQALQRQKQHAVRIEGEMYPIPRQFAFLMYQFGPRELRLRIGGDDLGVDPFLTMRRSDFLEAIDYDMRFRGATKSLNRELAAQQLGDTMEKGQRMGAITPTEVRGFLKEILTILGHKGVDRFITAAGTTQLEAAAKAQAIAAAQASQVARMPTPPEVPAAAGAAATPA